MRKSACLLQRLWQKNTFFDGRINKLGSIPKKPSIGPIVPFAFFPADSNIYIYKSTWIFLVFLNGSFQLAFGENPSKTMALIQFLHPEIHQTSKRVPRGLMGNSSIPSGEHTKSNGKWLFIVDFPSYRMVIFHCYVSSPEGNWIWMWSKALWNPNKCSGSWALGISPIGRLSWDTTK